MPCFFDFDLSFGFCLSSPSWETTAALVPPSPASLPSPLGLSPLRGDNLHTLFIKDELGIREGERRYNFLGVNKSSQFVSSSLASLFALV
jgi:hypothetical protein